MSHARSAAWVFGRGARIPSSPAAGGELFRLERLRRRAGRPSGRSQHPAHQATRVASRKPSADSAADLRRVVKITLWAAFLTALLVAHAALRFRIQMLRVQARRYQDQWQALVEEQRRLSSQLGTVQSSARIKAVAEQQLGLVSASPAGQILVRRQTQRAVEQSASFWRNPLKRDLDPATPPAWKKTLARMLNIVLWTGKEPALSTGEKR